MANQIKTKFYKDDSVKSEKILLENNTSLRGKDSVGSTVGLLKVDATNKVIAYRSTGAEEIAYLSDVNSGGTALQDHIDDATDAHDASAISVSAISNLAATNVQAALAELQGDIDGIDAAYVNTSGDTMTGNLAMGGNKVTGIAIPTANGEALVYDQLGAASGVVPLNASTKIDSIYLPSYVDDVQEYANLAAFPVSGEASKIYVALDTNKTYRWSGSAYIEISPSEVNSVNGQTGIVSLDTDDISEGAANFYYTEARFDSSLSGKDTDDLSEGVTNLYFTEARAKSAAVSDTTYGAGWNGVTDVAASKNAVYDQVELERARILALENVSPEIFKKTLISGDITNEYINLTHLAIETNDFHVFVDRLAIHQGAAEDYTLSVVSGVTRITFLNDMVNPGNQSLAIGDSIYVRYKRSL